MQLYVSNGKVTTERPVMDKNYGIAGQAPNSGIIGIKQTEAQNDRKKERYEQRLMSKIKSGKKLTPEELRYVQENMPGIYPQVMRQQKLRDMVKVALESCRSKEEVQQRISNFMSGISDNDPCKDMMISAIQDAADEFKASNTYKKLPAVNDNTKHSKNSRSQKENDERQISYECDKNGYQTTYLEVYIDNKSYKA